MNTAQFKIDSEWNDGLTATVSIENNSDRPLNGWLFEFVADFEITQVWNAELVSREGDRYVFRHFGYNQTIGAGGERDFGFLAKKSAADSTQPKDFRLNGLEIGSGGSITAPNQPSTPVSPAPATPTTVEPLPSSPVFSDPEPTSPGPTQPSPESSNGAVDFAIANDWGSGFTGNLTFKNTSGQFLDGWTFEFTADFPIRELWGGEIISQQGNVYHVRPESWNRNLAPGETVSLGFNADVPTDQISAPNSYQLTAAGLTQPISNPSTPATPTPQRPAPGVDGDWGNGSNGDAATGGGNETESPISPPNATDNPPQGGFNYGEALQKSFLFYEAQRAGDLPADNRIDWRGDSTLNDGADVGLDLSGGYFDAGDHVKFVFPMASSMTMLSWGLVEYRDAYATSGQLDEALEAIKWGTDFLLEAHQTSGGQTTSFAGQVGDGNVDHSYWGSPEAMNLPRPTALITAQAPGSDLAAEAAAALASASIVFRPSDAAYADELLDNAMQLYDFGDQYRGKYSDSISNAQSFYNSWSGYEDELSWGAAWIHEALEAKGSNDSSYLDKAQQNYNGLSNGWTQSWDNKSYGAAVLLAQETGDSRYQQDVEGWLNNWTDGGVNTTNGGLAWLDQWGSLRYSANTAFLAGVYGDTVNDPGQKYSDFAEDQIDYILGDNPAGFSYMVGFGDDFAQNPHHRGASGTTSINDSADNRHILYGALVGGPSAANDFAYRDERTDYIANEVALDYNAGLTGALARQYDQFGGNPLSEAELNGLVGVTTQA